MNWQAVFTAMLPEHFLLAGIVVLICVEIASSRPRGSAALSLAALTAAVVAAAWLHVSGYVAAPFAGQYSVDPASSLAKAIVLALAAPVVLLARDEFEHSRFYLLLLSSLYGACMILSADSLLTLFLGLELMSLPVYVLVLLAFRRPESAEAALKYLVLSGAATATFLMGVSLLYGASGSLALSAFATALGSAGDPLAQAAVVLVIVAFFLKAAVVPFHAWAPDAYEAASVPVTAYMATIIKAAVLLAVVRLFGMVPLSQPIVGLIAILPLASIVWGNLAAMRQSSFRRMIAYSSIAHAGYLFYAFLGDGPGRFEAVVFYVLAYGLMNLLAFASLPPSEDDAVRDRLDHLRGLFHREALRRDNDRHRDAVARRHSPAARIHREVPDLQERDGGRVHAVRGARPGRELPRHLLLPAGDPVPVHEPAGAGCRSRPLARRGAGRRPDLPGPGDPPRRAAGMGDRSAMSVQSAF